MFRSQRSGICTDTHVLDVSWLHVDYARTAESLFIDVATHYVQYAMERDISLIYILLANALLQRLKRSCLRLPSWVPDWEQDWTTQQVKRQRLVRFLQEFCGLKLRGFVGSVSPSFCVVDQTVLEVSATLLEPCAGAGQGCLQFAEGAQCNDCQMLRYCLLTPVEESLQYMLAAMDVQLDGRQAIVIPGHQTSSHCPAFIVTLREDYVTWSLDACLLLNPQLLVRHGFDLDRLLLQPLATISDRNGSELSVKTELTDCQAGSVKALISTKLLVKV